MQVMILDLPTPALVVTVDVDYDRETHGTRFLAEVRAGDYVIFTRVYNNDYLAWREAGNPALTYASDEDDARSMVLTEFGALMLRMVLELEKS